MMRDALLPLGIVLSTASQLRPLDLPIGPGEVCLVIWIATALGDTKKLLRCRTTQAFTRLLIFWILFTISLCLGSMTAYVIGDIHDNSLFVHDILAYPLLAATSLLVVTGSDAGERINRSAWLLVQFSIVFFVAQIACGYLVNIPPIDPWYWDRLRGFSQNPNQLAFFCAILVFMPLHFVEHAAGARRRLTALLCFVLAVVVGRLTRSDTFGLILVTGLCLFALLKLRSWLLTSQRGFTMRSAAAAVLILVAPVIVIVSLPFTGLIEGETQELAKGMTKGNTEETEETANIRLDSWRRAIDRGIQSEMLGLGPGPHLQIPAVLVAARRDAVEPKYIEHPDVNGTPNFEAHNSFLDLLTQGGLIATATFVWLLVTTTWLLYRSRQDALTVMLWGITVLSVFHLIVRHPLFWFAIAFGLVMGAQSGTPSPRMLRSR